MKNFFLVKIFFEIIKKFTKTRKFPQRLFLSFLLWVKIKILKTPFSTSRLDGCVYWNKWKCLMLFYHSVEMESSGYIFELFEHWKIEKLINKLLLVWWNGEIALRGLNEQYKGFSRLPFKFEKSDFPCN